MTGAALKVRRLSSASRANPVVLAGTCFTPLPEQLDSSPRLYVVVDTEAEFDWSRPLDRSFVAVSAMVAQERAQVLFDGFGLRPVYVVDYAVASQPEGYEPLRRILDRQGCAIGAHLHPWINPPFEEPVTERNSFCGNLTPDLEERKLRALVRAIERAFQVRPLFFRAGRFGIGANTYAILARLGFAVDFSILPVSDLRRKGGADFRRARAVPYWVEPEGLLSVPATRGQVGRLAPLPDRLQGLVQSAPALALRLPGILARLGLVNTVTLTPEGVPADEQIALLRAMLRAGQRTFVLHYHSPSLAPGHTPYVRTGRDLAQLLGRIERVCRCFFDDLGGLPGNPADLLPTRLRHALWPPADVRART